MKHTLKKSLAIIMAAAILVCSAPLSGFVGLELPDMPEFNGIKKLASSVSDFFDDFATKAEAATSGYYTYTVSNGEATITDVNESISGDITIPSTLGEYPVTSIGDGAFSRCWSLTSVTISDSVVSIGERAFFFCNGLKSATISDSVTNIGSGAFYYCNSLKSIEIPDGVTLINRDLFKDCHSLSSVTIPDSVTVIGREAFKGCSSLTSITIPDSITSIGWEAFRGCTSLTSITIPDSVINLDYCAFFDCTSLINVTIGNGIKSIDSGTFAGCSSLTSLAIPNSVTSIGNNAFEYCYALTSITIPDSVTSIGNYVFRYCNSLTNITIPDSIIGIGYLAFEYCESLNVVFYTGNEAEWHEISIEWGNENLTNATIYFDYIPEGGNKIGDYEVGDIIEFGWYPQSKVTDSDIISALNSSAGDNKSWTSYGYYSGTGDSGDGQMKPGDYMRYKDVVYGSNKYRGVVFDTYRPEYTGYKTSTSAVTYQDDNGYTYGNVYWFKYEPIKWRALDPSTGMIMAETVIDSQPFNNYLLMTGEKGFAGTDYYWGDPESKYLANNYEQSSIRTWLNSEFYGVAFCEKQQNIINTTKVANNSSGSEIITDKIYLLSYDDMLNTSYGFAAAELDQDIMRRTSSSDYAECQGLYKNDDYNSVCWTLRTPFNIKGDYVNQVIYDGRVGHGQNSWEHIVLESQRINGVRPALNIDPDSEFFQSDVDGETTETEYIAKWIVDGHMVKVLSVPEGSIIESPENPVKEGYDFLGWTPEVPETMLPQHMTFTAVWQEAVTLPSDEPVVLEDGLNVFVNNTSLSFPTDEIVVIAVSRVTNNVLSIPENISVEIADNSVVQLFKVFNYDDLSGSSFEFLFNSMSDTFKNSTFVMLKTIGEGISGVKITDKETKESVSVPIKVYDDKYDYLRADKVPVNEYVPEMFGATVEKDYYNYYVNGIFVSDFEYTKVTGGYTFKMNAYNERYSLGAVEVFKEDGTLIKVEVIDKFETTGTSLFKTFEAGWFVIKDIAVWDVLSFRSHETSKLTEIEVFVPEGGFVRIVNDSTASTPCFLINMFDAVFSAGKVVKSMASTVDGIVTHLSKSQVKEITKEAVGKFIANSYYLNIADKYKEKIVDGFVEDVTESALVSTISWIAQGAEGLLIEIDLTLKDLCMGALESTVGVAEDVFVVLTGTVGICLSGAFTGMKCVNFNDQLLDWKETFNGQGFRGIVTPNEYSAGLISSSDGISVITNNNVSAETVLQTIRILKDANIANNIGELVEIDDYKLYDISLLNNGVETQPDGTVTVNVPVPVGFENDITVLRENDDGTWEIIASEVIDRKIVFNVDHFCLFAFVENKSTVNFEIRTPSITTISYGDSIVLHADIDGELPAGYTVEWTASNSNFSYKADGSTCTISPEKSGDTTFTATIYDADGNPVSTDEQTMTSKAGFFQKIIAFFKKLFGLTKTIPQAFKGIF